MGVFFANFHVRSDEAARVAAAVTASGATKFRVLPSQRGWVAVYEDRASSQDDQWIRQLANDLSARLQTACVAFLVHDSDIACYWLTDRGELLDEYNSCPEYFEPPTTDADRQRAEADRTRLQGDVEVFFRYCRPGLDKEKIDKVLRSETLFAEDVIAQLADFLGIEARRAMADYSSGIGGTSTDDQGSAAERDDDLIQSAAGLGGGAAMANAMGMMQQQLAKAFASDVPTSAQSDSLAQAAADGNIAEIDRLLQAGADVNAPGLTPLEAGLGLMPSALQPLRIPLAPLLAAASRGAAAAVQRLIEFGANAKESHARFGSPLHLAAQSGSAETVRVLLAAGIPAHIKSQLGHTPLDLLQMTRQQIEQVKMISRAMPNAQLESVLAGLMAREAGFKECEDVLRAAGG
jgi:hypothetical protein